MAFTSMGINAVSAISWEPSALSSHSLKPSFKSLSASITCFTSCAIKPWLVLLFLKTSLPLVESAS